jgi:hypothetical protein
LLKLRLAVSGHTPSWLVAGFRARCLPLVPWCNCLATNPRMLILFALLLIGHPIWYFAVELTVLNLLLLLLLRRHETIFRNFYQRVSVS